MLGRLVLDELESMCKEAVLGNRGAASTFACVVTEGKPVKLQAGWPASR